MKNQVQSTGNRKWFGSDFILLQDEIYSALSAFFADYGNCIVSGGVFTYSDELIGTLTDGYAYLTDDNGENGQICKITGDTFSTGVATLYLTQGVKTYPEISAYGRAYETGGTKSIINEYYAEISTSVPAHSHYIKVNSYNNKHFRNMIQTALFRFVTDTEKTTWNNKLTASSYTAADVLSKLLTVDGSGSGLDADLLDSHQADYFQFAADCVSANTVSKVVKRDASGNFAAGTITVTDIIIA